MNKKTGSSAFVVTMILLTAVFSVIDHTKNSKWRMLAHARMLETHDQQQQLAQQPTRKQACIMKFWMQRSSGDTVTLAPGCEDIFNTKDMLASTE